jgi:hypothetical protein
MMEASMATYSDALGQKRMMATSVGLDSEHWVSRAVNVDAAGDYGADPIGDGTFRMVPSGDIVDLAERMRRLPVRR